MSFSNLENNVLEIVQVSLWGNRNIEADEQVYEELKNHSILLITANVLPNIIMADELRELWKMDILRQIAYNTKYAYEQSVLPLDVPYVILKGTSAAMYYPDPMLRTMGDIDIITRREDYENACDTLLSYNYKEEFVDVINPRHRAFSKNHIDVEVHAFFATMNNPVLAEKFDNIIYTNINSSHILPDYANGLVLIEHINQHLEDGLGLRQIIDWMMFVDKCLPDDKWPFFSELAKETGLEKLAVTVTRMCELYLGLPSRQWSADADENLCAQLMEYILACGNFGNKRTTGSDTSEYILSLSNSPGTVFKLLQERGLVNWKVAEKYSFLRPFAWIYQIGKYFLQGFKRPDPTAQLYKDYQAAKKRSKMLEELGVRRITKKQVVYRDGKYIER